MASLGRLLKKTVLGVLIPHGWSGYRFNVVYPQDDAATNGWEPHIPNPIQRRSVMDPSTAAIVDLA